MPEFGDHSATYVQPVNLQSKVVTTLAMLNVSDFNVTASRVHARHVTQVTAGVLEKNNAQQPFLSGLHIHQVIILKPNHYTQFAMRVGERVDGVSFDVYKHTLTLNAPIKTSSQTELNSTHRKQSQKGRHFLE